MVSLLHGSSELYSLADQIPRSLLRSSKRSNPPEYLNASGLARRIFIWPLRTPLHRVADLGVSVHSVPPLFWTALFPSAGKRNFFLGSRHTKRLCVTFSRSIKQARPERTLRAWNGCKPTTSSRLKRPHREAPSAPPDLFLLTAIVRVQWELRCSILQRAPRATQCTDHQ